MELMEAGYIVKTHGYKGDLRIRLLDGVELAEELPGAIFIRHRDEDLPFFPVRMKFTSGNEAIVHLEGLEDKESAQVYRGSTFYMRREDLAALPELEPAERSVHLVGYTVIDTVLGEIGPVERIDEYPQQNMLVVRYGAKRVLIPIRPELITGIDDDAQVVTTDLPEGFLEI